METATIRVDPSLNVGPRPSMIVGDVVMGAVGPAKFKPSISLDPGTITAIEGFEEFKDYLAPAQNALSTAFEGLKQIAKAREFADRNGAWNEAAKLMNVAAASEKKQESMTRAFDTASKNLTTAANALEASLSAPIESAAFGPMAAEIRAHVKSLSSDARNKFVNDMLKAGDLKSLSAVLGGPAFLSGMTEDMHKAYTRLYHEHKSPEAVRRLRATRAALDMLDQRGPLIWTQVEQAMGGSFAMAKKLRDANSEAERALLMNDTNA